MDLQDLMIGEPDFGFKIFAVGDIHGCLTSLEKLLDQIPINWGKDYLIFLGDYIDRGPDSRAVIDLLIELKKEYPERIITLKGNHEWMLERFLKGIDMEIYLYNGGEATLRNYFNYKTGKLEIPSEHLEFLKNLKLYFEWSNYIFVHAGLRPGIPLEFQTEEDLLWIRNSFYFSEESFPKVIVFGHTPFAVPLVLKDRIGIDTGCVYGGYLTAVELPELKFYQTPCGGRL